MDQQKTSLIGLLLLMTPLSVLSNVNINIKEAEGEDVKELEIKSCDGYEYKASEHLNEESNRVIKTKDINAIGYKLKDNVNKVTVTEVKRSLQIVTDIRTIYDAKSFLTGNNDSCVVYSPQKKRSTITFNSYINDTKVKEKEIIWGEEEHWYLSGDLPITDIEQLTYNSETKKVELKEKPASFYLGINYQFGDIFKDHGYWSLDNVSFKLMLKASDKPTESMGVGLSYKYKKANIFIARIWTKNENTVPSENLDSTATTAVGVSFKINDVIDWFKD